jgi:DNA-binding response OmpR family regulator
MKSIAADHYVVKSFDLSELKEKIREVLSWTKAWPTILSMGLWPLKES